MGPRAMGHDHGPPVIPPMSHIFGACCDRCGTTFLIGQFPHVGLCPPCYLGGMEPEARKRLLTHIGKRVA